MNKKILELAGQVCDTLDDGDWNIPNEFIEKFAQLIIEECALRAEAYAYMSPNFTALAEELREMK